MWTLNLITCVIIQEAEGGLTQLSEKKMYMQKRSNVATEAETRVMRPQAKGCRQTPETRKNEELIPIEPL